METKLIEDIVNDIYKRLGVPLGHTSIPQLIGMQFYIEHITSWLKDGSSHTADILTIWGMSGIGKTSLANYVYKLHHCEFTSSFVGDISRRCVGKYPGLIDVQKQLCDDISKTSSSQFHDGSGYTSKTEMALASKKVLLVLDDVDSIDQLDALLGNKVFHPGSKVIITTKDSSLVERCALFKTKVKPNHIEYTLKGLFMDASLELLCHHAFMCNYPNEGFEEVSEKLAMYCEGHPLALEILGKSLHKRNVEYWEECIKVLKKEPLSGIEKVKKALQMSFDSLSENDKELFKHIACFFVGKDRDLTETVLKACDINTVYGITNLTEKCFLDIRWNNELAMHSLIQDMGRDLVRQESPNKPCERTRLWCHEESFKVLNQKEGSENLIGLALDMRMLEIEKLSGSLQLSTEALDKMGNLRLLQLNYVKINGSYKNFSKELRWLCMHGSYFKSIPSELPMENLVVLDMSHSNIQSFDMSYSKSQRLVNKVRWLIGSRSEGKPVLGSLKILDLSFCEQLQSLGGFSELPTLERLILRKCISLIEVCASVGQCVELVYIDLSQCYKLTTLPTSLHKLEKVKTIVFDGYYTSSGSQIETIPRDLKLISFSLPSSLRTLSLANNNMCNDSFCLDLSCLSMLEELCLSENPIVSMPSCVRTLPRLKKLSMNNCRMLISIEYPPCTLRELSIWPYLGDDGPLSWKINFDPEMSPLELFAILDTTTYLSIEVDGMLKIQGLVAVEEKVLHSLGWTGLDSIKERRLAPSFSILSPERSPTKMYYEFGIFSTIYEGEGMPNWIIHKSKGPSISFTIPSSPNNLRGLNFCCTMESIPYLEAPYGLVSDYYCIPVIKITNVTKNQTWIYHHCVTQVYCLGENCCYSLLSHWMFGPNEMKAGDHITVKCYPGHDGDQATKECGISVVYDGDGKIEEEDMLGYFKSWNHIIGGDLSGFQLTTEEYFLQHSRFNRWDKFSQSYCDGIIGYETSYKDERISFKAFSQKKSEISLGQVDFSTQTLLLPDY